MTSTILLRAASTLIKEAPHAEMTGCICLSESLGESVACSQISLQNATADSESKTSNSQNSQPSETQLCYLQLLFCSPPPGFGCLYPYPPFGLIVLSVFGPRGSTDLGSVRISITAFSWEECQYDLHVWGFAQSWTCGGCICSKCCTELQFAVSPAPVWSGKAESSNVTLSACTFSAYPDPWLCHPCCGACNTLIYHLLLDYCHQPGAKLE